MTACCTCRAPARTTSQCRVVRSLFLSVDEPKAQRWAPSASGPAAAPSGKMTRMKTEPQSPLGASAVRPRASLAGAARGRHHHPGRTRHPVAPDAAAVRAQPHQPLAARRRARRHRGRHGDRAAADARAVGNAVRRRARGSPHRPRPRHPLPPGSHGQCRLALAALRRGAVVPAGRVADGSARLAGHRAAATRTSASPTTAATASPRRRSRRSGSAATTTGSSSRRSHRSSAPCARATSSRSARGSGTPSPSSATRRSTPVSSVLGQCPDLGRSGAAEDHAQCQRLAGPATGQPAPALSGLARALPPAARRHADPALARPALPRAAPRGSSISGITTRSGSPRRSTRSPSPARRPTWCRCCSAASSTRISSASPSARRWRICTTSRPRARPPASSAATASTASRKPDPSRSRPPRESCARPRDRQAPAEGEAACPAAAARWDSGGSRPPAPPGCPPLRPPCAREADTSRHG